MTGIVAGTAALMGVGLGWWGAALVAVMALVALAARMGRAVAAACAVAISMAVLGACRGDAPRPPAALTAVSPAISPMSVVTSPVRTSSRQHFVGEAKSARALTSTTRVCVTSGPAPIVRVGDTVLVDGPVEPAADLSIGVRAALAARECSATMLATSMQVIDSTQGPHHALGEVRARLGAVLRGAAPGDTGVLLAGLVTGEDDGFSPQRREAFIQTGTTHLTAVSGSNLALVAGMLTTVGAATIGRHRAAWHLVTILAVWTYALVSGSQPPSVRAAIVATAAICAFRFGRRPDFPTLILLAAGVMVVVEPKQISSLGFLLSVAASLALAMVGSGLLANDRTSPIAFVLATTIAAQVATMPILLPVFGTVSLTSIPANIIAAPLVALAMPLAALAGVTGLFWLPLGEALAAPAAFLASALISIVDLLAASGGYIIVGVPPRAASVAMAIAAVALIFIMGPGDKGELVRGWLDKSKLR